MKTNTISLISVRIQSVLSASAGLLGALLHCSNASTESVGIGPVRERLGIGTTPLSNVNDAFVSNKLALSLETFLGGCRLLQLL
jgi:hypothetical protein